MPYCINCGVKISKEAKFCPECGFRVNDSQPELTSPPEENIPVSKKMPDTFRADKTYKLLRPGEVFNKHYRIKEIIGRDNDGVSYLAIDERNGEQRSLKLFYQAYFDNVSKLLGSINQLSRMTQIIHPHIARVYEADQASKPAFIASQYIMGNSLARIKQSNPDLMNEERCRKIAGQLVHVAIAVRKAGFSVHDLNLNNIVMEEDGNIVVLSSGISLELREEKDDIFHMGILLARLFSSSPFSDTLYVPVKILEKKFEYISGITTDVNEIISKCLSKNPLLRYSSFSELSKDFSALKPVNPKNVYLAPESEPNGFSNKPQLTMPKRRLDLYFWLVIIFIIIFIAVLMTTNLLDAIFGHGKTTLKFTGFKIETRDSTDELAAVTDANNREIWSGRSEFKPEDKTGTTNSNPSPRINPNIFVPPTQRVITESPDKEEVDLALSTKGTAIKEITVTAPEGMVYIYGDTYAYGTLKKDARDNASLNGFYISKTEVTQSEWKRYMRPVEFSVRGEGLPVDNVSWLQAIQYCNVRSKAEGLEQCYTIRTSGSARSVTCDFKANGYRLPTEAEWEYAARGKELNNYSGSDNPNQVAWYRDNALSYIHLVKTKAANGFGIYDMTGNVSEWCWDWYDSNYPKTMPFINPKGPDSGSEKVIRGGNIGDKDGRSLEVLYRSKADPGRGYDYVGFRVVRSTL